MSRRRFTLRSLRFALFLIQCLVLYTFVFVSVESGPPRVRRKRADAEWIIRAATLVTVTQCVYT